VSWLHDGNIIAFDMMGTDGYLDIYSIHPDGTGLTSLTDGHPQLKLHNGNPSWHPSGTYIVFQSQDPDLHLDTAPYVEKFVSSPGVGIHNNLWITTSTGSQFWKLTHVEENHGVLHPHFSPDGTKLLWTEIINSELDGLGYWTITLADFVVDEDGPFLRNIQTFRPLNLQLYEVHGFSPDGKCILFSGVEAGGFYYDMEIRVLHKS
jgi:Tol biopolymer transport system component